MPVVWIAGQQLHVILTFIIIPSTGLEVTCLACFRLVSTGLVDQDFFINLLDTSQWLP